MVGRDLSRGFRVVRVLRVCNVVGLCLLVRSLGVSLRGGGGWDIPDFTASGFFDERSGKAERQIHWSGSGLGQLSDLGAAWARGLKLFSSVM